MKKIIEKFKKINSKISYYKNGNKKKEKLNIIEKEKEVFETLDGNSITNDIESSNVSNEDGSKKENINEEQKRVKESKKSLNEQIKELLKNEKFLNYLTIGGSVIIFLFHAYISWNISVIYGVPIDSVKIDTKASSLLIFLICIPVLLAIIMSFSKKEYENLNKIMYHLFFLICNSLYCLMIVDYRKGINISLEGYIGIFISLLVSLLVLLLVSFIFKKIIKVIKVINIVLYILLISVLLLAIYNRAKEFQIVTLKNGEKKVVIGYYNSEYLAFDYDEKESVIFKSPIYNISISDVKEFEMKEFNKDTNNFQKEKELQIITLKNKKQRVILSKPNGEYNAFDFEKSGNKLTIYKIPSYEIITSDIEKIDKPKKFKEIEYKNFMLSE